MIAAEALRAVFDESGWKFTEKQTDALLAASLELENYTVEFCTYSEEELFLSVSLMHLPEAEEPRFELLKSAAALCACLWQNHSLNLTVTGLELNLELCVKTEQEDFREKIRAFLDDCDYFQEQLQTLADPETAPDTQPYFKPLTLPAFSASF